MLSIQAERLKKSVLYFARSILSSLSFLLSCNYVIYIVYYYCFCSTSRRNTNGFVGCRMYGNFLSLAFTQLLAFPLFSFTYRKRPAIQQWYHTQCTYFVRFAMFCPIPSLNLLFPLFVLGR